MTDEVKAPEAPVASPEAPEAVEPKTRREQIEDLVGPAPVPPEIQEPEKELKKEPEKEPEKEQQDDPLEKVKRSVQKRIDKLTAQKKSAEEELAEARAEIERLRQGVKPEPESKDEKAPSIDQVKAYILKMTDEGNYREAEEARLYLIDLKEKQAIENYRKEQEKTRSEAENVKQKQLRDWTDLCKDYQAYTPDGAPDHKSELSLTNQNGLLYKTALSLYNDKELQADYYGDSDKIRGFRRAVADAYREIHQQGLLNKTPKEPVIRRNPREVLAEPDAEAVEETATTPQLLSDTDVVREEIKARKRNRIIRTPSRS